jgi:formate-dependent nitrite reductase membrane component NrfD
MIRPQWKSWLTIGAFILTGFSIVGGLWWLIEVGARLGVLPAALATGVRLPAMWLGFVLAVGVAVYTGFLFGQAEGRDLWQSSLLPFHLLVQALLVGAAFLLVLDLFFVLASGFVSFVRFVFILGLVVDLFITLVGEFGMPHASEVAAKAAHEISGGRYRAHFWGGSIALGHVLPFILVLIANPVSAALAGIAAIAGLYLFEYAFVMAPQEIPNS